MVLDTWGMSCSSASSGLCSDYGMNDCKGVFEKSAESSDYNIYCTGHQSLYDMDSAHLLDVPGVYMADHLLSEPHIPYK